MEDPIYSGVVAGLEWVMFDEMPMRAALRIESPLTAPSNPARSRALRHTPSFRGGSAPFLLVHRVGDIPDDFLQVRGFSIKGSDLRTQEFDSLLGLLDFRVILILRRRLQLGCQQSLSVGICLGRERSPAITVELRYKIQD